MSAGSSGSRDRGDVVVRVRQIAEDRAALSAMAAMSALSAARAAAEAARRRAMSHPLGDGSQPMSAERLWSAGVTSAVLSESARRADQVAAEAGDVVAAAREVADGARAQRRAAQRYVERRNAAIALEASRRQQRALDEAALGTHRSTA